MSEEQNSELHSIYDVKTTIELVQAMSALRGKKDEYEEVLKTINQHYDFLRYVVVPQRFDDEGLQNMKLEGIGRVSLTSGLYVSIKADKKQDAYEFLSDTGHGGIITNTINAQTLAATIKSMIQKGEEVPDTLFTVTPWTRASITKA